MRRRDTITLGIGAVALVASVLVVGSVLRWTQAVVAALVALALASQLLARRRLERLSPIVVLLSVAAGLTAFQLLPLPPAIINFLDPVGDQLRSDGAIIAQTHPWRSISLDPSASLRGLALLIILIGVAQLSLRFAITERGRWMLLGGVAATCGIAAVITGVHTLVNADELYGLYTPVHSHTSPVFGPLLNQNHLGGLTAFGAVLSIGLAFYERQSTQARVFWIVNAVACAAVSAASLSRGAVVGLAIGLAVTAGILFAGRLEKRRSREWRRDLPVALVIGVGLALALYASAGDVGDQLGTTSVTELSQPISKYAAWKSSLQLVRESPWVGIGRNAVESNLTRVHPASAYFTFSHLENEYLSAVVEWGIPGAIAIAVLFGACVAMAIRRWRDGPLAAAALGALAMILFQSSVDFGVELLGLAVPVTIVACTVQLVALRPAASPVRTQISRALLIAALLASAVVLLLPITKGVTEDHDDLIAEGSPTMAQIRESIERHPLDYFGFGLAADTASRGGDIHAVEYLNIALALHPTHPGLHRLAGRMLVGLKNYKQAAVEYSLAMEAEVTPHELLEEIITLVPDADMVALSIPTDYPNVDTMTHALDELKRSDIAQKWLARVAALPQHDLRVIDMLYELALARDDVDAALAAAELRMRVARTTTSRVMLAKVHFARKQYDLLLQELADVQSWTGRIDEKADAWLILCDVEIARKDWDRSLECLHRLDSSGLLVDHTEISKRITEIGQQRAYEAKLQAAEALERSITKPKPAGSP